MFPLADADLMPSEIFSRQKYFSIPRSVSVLFYLTDFNLRRGIKYTKRCLIE